MVSLFLKIDILRLLDDCYCLHLKDAQPLSSHDERATESFANDRIFSG